MAERFHFRFWIGRRGAGYIVAADVAS